MAAAGSFSIYAKTLTGSTAEVRTSPDETIATLKEKIESALKLSIPIVRLVYDSKELNDTQTVGDHGVAKESIIIVVVGSSKPCHFFFALDESGSMTGGRWQQLISSFQDFVKMRHEEAEKKGTKIVDLVSVFFHQTGCRVASWCKPSGERVPFDSIPLADVTPESLVNDFQSGGNNFDAVLSFMTPYLRKSAADYVPVVMFMTDGGDCGHRESAYERMRGLKKEMADLRLYVTVVYTTSASDIEGGKQLCLSGGSDIETFFTYIEQEGGADYYGSPAFYPGMPSAYPSAPAGFPGYGAPPSYAAPAGFPGYGAPQSIPAPGYPGYPSISPMGAPAAPMSFASPAAPTAFAPPSSAQARMTKQWEHAYQCNSSYMPR